MCTAFNIDSIKIKISSKIYVCEKKIKPQTYFLSNLYNNFN